MRPVKDISHAFFLKFFIIATLLAGSALPSLAQHTVVQDAGGGRKLELHYNAAGQVAEIDTVGADGKLLQKQVLEYSPGAYVPQTTSTSYWPNGNVHKVTRNTYDDNSNFTGEFVKVFDESGRQTAGHELMHDPQTNSYRCNDWNTDAQKFQLTKCPAGEESSGPPETLKKFTQEEVTQQLTAARQAAQQAASQTPKSMPAMPLPPLVQTETGNNVKEAPGTNVKEVGLVFPARVHIGDRVSGSVVEDPSAYEGAPGLTVTRVALPFPATGDASTLAGWRVLISGEPTQAANGPIALTVPPGQLELAVLFRQADGAGAPVSKLISIPRIASSKPKPLTSYMAPAICLKRQACVIHGPFTGNSNKTFAAFEQRPASIVAETSDTAYIAIPERTEAGSRPLVIEEGSKAIVFPVVVAEFTVSPEHHELTKGEKLLMYAVVDGPQELPDPLWAPGTYPPSNLEEARKLIPGFQAPHGAKGREKNEEEEKREASAKAGAAPEQEEDLGGEILLVVKNLSPSNVTFRESKNGTYTFHLKPSSFSMGEFKYKFVVEALQAGTFAVQNVAIPFLAPLTGQEFAVTADNSAK